MKTFAYGRQICRLGVVIAMSSVLVLAFASCSDHSAEPDAMIAANEAPVVSAPLSSHLYARIGDVSKRRLVVAPGQNPTIEVAAREAGTLHLAAGLPAGGEGDPAETASCQVSFDDGIASNVIAALELHTGQTSWSEEVVELPELGAGRMTFVCLDRNLESIDVAWAQPLFAPRAANPAAPVVILISLDTLRADYVAGFGAPDDMTPALARLGREGQRYVATTSESAWTLPSHFSLFYSRLYGFPPAGREVVGLAQILSDHGFVTAGLTNGGFIGAIFRFQIGFDHYAEYLPEEGKESDIDLLPGILSDGRDWIDRFANVPLFLFLHTYAVHEVTADETDWLRDHHLIDLFDPTVAQIDDARALYDRLVRSTDRILEPFFNDLRRVAETRPVTVVIVSDHGEAFGEHDTFRHGSGGPTVKLHDELTRVPLIVWGPGNIAAGKIFDRPTMLSDVAPSILDSLGLPIPESMFGESLWPMWSGGVSGTTRTKGSISQVDRLWSLRETEAKLIVELGRNKAYRLTLYDLGSDPKELDDLAAKNPSIAAPIEGRLAARLADFGVKAERGAPIIPSCALCGWKEIGAFWDLIDPPVAELADHPDQREIDEATRQRLKALGYIH